MVELEPMSAFMQQAATSQGMIGWRKFMEGKVTTKIASIQRTHCAVAPCMMNSNNWMCHFNFHILHMTHL